MNKYAMIIVASCLGMPSHAAVRAGDWPSYGLDPGGARFSPLRQITPANAPNLRMAWTYHMDPSHDESVAPSPAARVRGFSSEATPLVIDGVLYLGTPYGRVVALDADSGRELWSYALPPRDTPALRGLSYWAGQGGAPRLLVGTTLGRLIALDIKSGQPIDGFGDGGIVNLKTHDIMNGLPNAPYGMSAPGAIYRNLIILGSRTQEMPALGPSGDVRAFDVLTGKRVWTFHAIPQSGTKGHESWAGDSGERRSGVNVWNIITVDEQRGIAYLSFGAPAVDRFGGDRKGDNLYSGSLVAVDAKTGQYLWHFQTLHHDIWDYDLGTPPTLLDVRRGVRTIPAVAAMGKTGLLFLLDRVTGKPIYDVVETPVPASQIADEQASPTQPIPSKPPQLARNSFSFDEVANVTPELRAFCGDWIKREHLAIGTRFAPITAATPIIRFPGSAGGPLWGGGAFDPALGYFIVNSNDRGSVDQLVQAADGNWSVTSRGFRSDTLRMSCQQPPWGSLTAVNVNTGEIAWRVNLGITDNAPLGSQNTGRLSNGGPIVTASGVTFIAGTDDARMRAFDSRSGRELWTYKLDYSGQATPVTYLGKSGRQYVAIVATGGSALASPAGGDSLVAFALPQGAPR